MTARGVCIAAFVDVNEPSCTGPSPEIGTQVRGATFWFSYYQNQGSVLFQALPVLRFAREGMTRQEVTKHARWR